MSGLKKTFWTAETNLLVFDYKALIVTLCVIYVFLDFVRRMFEGEQKLLVVLDIVILAIFLRFFYRKKLKLRHTLSLSIFQFLLIGYITVILVQVVNFTAPDLVSTLAGLRTYLLPVPFIWVGYHVAIRENFITIEKLARILLMLSVISIVFGCYMFFTDASSFVGVLQSLVSPMGHDAHSFGATTQELTSSFFASSSRFSTFLLIAYLFIWGVWKTQQKPVLLLFVIFLIGFWVSGSRTGFTLFMIFNVISMLFFHKKEMLLFASISIFFGSVYYIADSIYSWNIFSHESEVVGGGGLSSRIDYMFDDFGQYVKRVEQALPISRIKLENSELLSGVGLGKYGQEALLSPTVASEVHKWYQAFFEERHQYPAEDSGFVKIIIELGLIGAVVYFLFFGIVILYSLMVIIHSVKNNNYLGFAIGWFPLFWLALFLKGHPVISDVFVSSFLYMSIGFILAGTRYQYRTESSQGKFN